MWVELLSGLVAAILQSLFNFEGARADAPTVVKEAQHDPVIEDQFDKEVRQDVAAGRAPGPGGTV